MPRRFFRRYMPDENTIKKHPNLRRLEKFLHDPNLWHLNRHSVSLAFMVGIFCAFLPIPMQMFVAAVLAIFVRSNLPISVALVWISNPITMPPIFYFCYQVGVFLLGAPTQHIVMDFSVQWLSESLSLIWQPLLLGSIICGVVFGSLGYIIVRFFWAWRVIKHWEERRRRRKKSS